ncbi:class I SAM-dependent methyltransferase [Candidatus Pacearchaeota archaeon]|nr:class I SAM-dependent methyltransferase [Candidatus Pacearchaeota archaeon]
MTEKDDFERIYENPGAVWTMKEPPLVLKDLVASKKVRRGKAIDIACGEGFYSIYLAQQGFDVLGVDFSERAIKYARNNAHEAERTIRFVVLDVEELGSSSEKFDFALEWGLLHHLSPEQLHSYVPKVHSLLNHQGLYASASFNINSTIYGSPGDKHRETKFGTKLTYYALDELREVFRPHFNIIREEVIALSGRGVTQPGNFFLLEKS